MPSDDVQPYDVPPMSFDLFIGDTRVTLTTEPETPLADWEVDLMGMAAEPEPAAPSLLAEGYAEAFPLETLPLHVGQPLETRDDFYALPIGATFGPEAYVGESYIVVTSGDREFIAERVGTTPSVRNSYDIYNFTLQGYNIVQSLPDDPSSIPETIDVTLANGDVTVVTCTVQRGGWSRMSSTGIQGRRIVLRPDPYDIGTEGSRASIYEAYRCVFCLREFPVDYLGGYVRGQSPANIAMDVCDQAMACHPVCEVCRAVNCGFDHVFCDACDQYDCGRDEEEHNNYCEHCDRYDCGRNHVINSYSFKPRPKWLGGTESPYYLGFELEVTSYDEGNDAQRVKDWTDANIGKDSVYLKEDGSVDGFEIVSHPMTPEFFESVDWRAFMSVVRQNDSGDRSYEPSGHGLHVHVSRTAFPNTLTLARWIYLWNAQRNRRTAIDLCRRESSNWAMFRDNDIRQLARVGRSKRREALDGWPNSVFYPNFERYSLINLTNDATVEFRGFRSTRRADAFKKSVRSIYRSVDYVRNMRPGLSTEAYSLDIAVREV